MPATSERLASPSPESEPGATSAVVGPFGYQLKTRQSIPAWLFTWLAGIVGKARETDQIGVLVLNRRHRPRREALVILRWGDWVALHGSPKVDGHDHV